MKVEPSFKGVVGLFFGAFRQLLLAVALLFGLLLVAIVIIVVLLLKGDPAKEQPKYKPVPEKKSTESLDF